jgi:peroxiredoxin
MNGLLKMWSAGFVMALALVVGCPEKASPPESPAEPEAPEPEATAPEAAASAEQINAIGVGETIPPVTVQTVGGQPFDLRQAVAAKPAVLVFYRGGWCMFCNRHLAELGQLQPQLTELGYQILAISPDRPEELARSVDQHQLTYVLLSDSSMSAARAFGLAFRMEEALVETYKNDYGIDLEAASGQAHHELPVPAAFVIDRSGIIRYASVNADYKVRVE